MRPFLLVVYRLPPPTGQAITDVSHRLALTAAALLVTHLASD
jgi:hypothetical protein